jgi:hypothetical protein
MEGFEREGSFVVLVLVQYYTNSKKNYCAHYLVKSTAVMQYIAWLKWYKIQVKRCLKDFFLLEFNKSNFLFTINVQETFINSVKIFELKNYFTTLF